MIFFLVTFFLGAAVGSFVNVLIDRTIAGRDWVSGRSQCDHCHKTLAWYDMVPILSFIVYRGTSRCCDKPLSWRYPLVEILVAILFLWWAAVGFWFFRLVASPLSMVQPAFWLMTGIILAILALADLFYGVVLMPIVNLGLMVTLLYRFTLTYFGAYQVSDLINAVIFAILSFGFFWSLYRATSGRGMADGDMYVALYLGLLLGWPKGLLAFFLSFILGAIIGLGLIVTRLRSRRDTLPFVPFMVLGVAISLVWGEQLLHLLGWV